MRHIETLIAQNRLAEALSALLQARPQDKATILTLQGRLSDIKRSEMLGTESYDTIALQKNRLVRAMLQLMAATPSQPGEEVADEVPAELPAEPKPGEMEQVLTEIQGLKDKLHQGEAAAPPKKRILFLAANPQQTTRLRTDEEHRILKAEFERGAEARSHYEFLPSQFALTLGELTRALDAEPHLIHFSGHGQADGIIITDEQGQAHMLPEAALRRICKRKLAGKTELVILNACFSTLQAELISSFDIHVVGTHSAIADDAAVVFAQGFYNALGRHRSLQDCYDDGMLQVETHHADQADKFEVWYQGQKLNW
jgi:hypothetical protein